MDLSIYQEIKKEFDLIKKEKQQLEYKILKLEQEKKNSQKIITDLLKELDVEKINILEVRENLIKDFFSLDEIKEMISFLEQIHFFFNKQKEKEFILEVQKKLSKTKNDFQKSIVFKNFLEEMKEKKFSFNDQFDFIKDINSKLLNKEINFLLEILNNLEVLKEGENQSKIHLKNISEMITFFKNLSKLF